MLGALLALPFPGLFIFGGWMMRQREQTLKPQRKAYLEGNETARRELDRARLIQRGSMAAVLIVVVVLARAIPRNYEGSATLVWIVAGVLIAAIILPALYSSLVQHRIEEAAPLQHPGEPPLTSEAKRTRTIWFVAGAIPPNSGNRTIALGVVVIRRRSILPAHVLNRSTEANELSEQIANLCLRSMSRGSPPVRRSRPCAISTARKPSASAAQPR